MILVTVGTEQYPFDALMNWVDILIRYKLIGTNEEIIVQYGSSSKLPDQVKIFKRLPEAQFKALLEQARLVISHCGEGSAMLLESLEKPYILVPRTKRFGEHVDNHQLEMADVMEKQGTPVARSPGDLARFLAAPEFSKLMYPSESHLCESLSDRYNQNQYKKVMVVCSSGGHFKYAQSLKPFLKQFQDISWITFKAATTQSQLRANQGNVYWAYSPTNRNIPNLLRNLFLAFKVLNHEQPDFVLSTGAGIAVPFLVIAQYFFRKKTVFVESKTRLKKLSLSAKILYKCSAVDQLIVRSRELEEQYKGTKFIGTNTTLRDTSEATIRPKQISQLKDTIFLSTPRNLSSLESTQFKTDFQASCNLNPKQVVLDMASTLFIDGDGLGALVSSFKIAKSRDIKLILWSVSPQVMSVLSMTKLDQVFTIEAATSHVRPLSYSATQQKPEKTHLTELNPVQRTLDVTVAILGLLIAVVLFIPISIGIKIDSPGPIFSKEVRYGLVGKFFQSKKFRSTVAPTVCGDINPPQITRFGRFLRKTKLDKLPLFWNVLAGDLSLIGPRAFTDYDIDSWFTPEAQLLEVKRGITSEWEDEDFPLPKHSATPESSQENQLARR